MADNAQKIPLARALNQFSENKIADAASLVGKSLPCSLVSVEGWIATVNFELTNIPYTLPTVQAPVASSNYIYLPLQTGDLGRVSASDAYMGGVSGLGGGTADLSLQANLSTLVFEPVGNNAWTPSDPYKIEAWGPHGFIVRDKNSQATVIGDTVAQTLTLAYGAASIVLSASGIALNGNVTITGALTATGAITAGYGGADQVGLQTHTHPTAATGSPSSPTAGT